MSDALEAFDERLLDWYERHGRHDLPWQRDPEPYRVWVSEIMLQQTQVATVIPYFLRFVEQFPDVRALATADTDAVLHAWSGLGYYARARHLQQAAREICERWDGQPPTTLEGWMALPGVGRSTAGAILALSSGQRHAILDGNVKRVLARYHQVEGWPGKAAVSRRLWALAEAHLPQEHARAYTQALMDLGATICTRRPTCAVCPIAVGCKARAAGAQTRLPSPRPRRTRPLREAVIVLATRDERAVLLQRRPPAGIWGGLWSFPEFADRDAALAWCVSRWNAGVGALSEWPVLRHSFTHFDLHLKPLVVATGAQPCGVMDGHEWLWYETRSPARVGLAAPVNELISALDVYWRAGV